MEIFINIITIIDYLYNFPLLTTAEKNPPSLVNRNILNKLEMEISQLVSCFNVTTVSYQSATLPLYQLNCVIKSSLIFLNTTEAKNMTCIKFFYHSLEYKSARGAGSS